MRKDGWEPCPRCGSKRVEQRGKLFFFFLPLVSGGCLVWLGLLFFPFLIIAALLVLCSPLAFLMPKMNQCKDCKYSWAVKKEKAMKA